jgi:hypothetical protein
MSNAAKPCFSSLLDGNPGSKFDARQVLAKRRERRRELLPWVAIQSFGLAVDEKLTAPVVRTGAVEAHGGEPFKRAN